MNSPFTASRTEAITEFAKRRGIDVTLFDYNAEWELLEAFWRIVTGAPKEQDA